MCRKILASLLAVVYSFIFTIQTNAKTEYKEVDIPVPPNILFLGDSIATGYGLDGYKQGKENCNSYANQLAAEYKSELDGKCTTSSENLAIDGQTSTQLLEGLISGTYDEALKKADAIVVSIGGNDLLRILRNIFVQYKENGESDFSLKQMIKSLSELSTTIDNNLTAFEENISKIASYINDKTDGVLIMQTLYNPFNQTTDVIQLKNFTEEKIIALNDSIRLHEDDKNAEYLVADVYSEFIDKGSELTRIKNIDIHPNQAGHNIIFQCVDNTIRLENYHYIQEVESQPVQAPINQRNNKNIITITGITVILTSIILIVIKTKFAKRKD